MIKTIFLLNNGNIAVFDEHGQQVSKYQKNPISELIKKINKNEGFTKDTELIVCGKRGKILKEYNNYSLEG